MLLGDCTVATTYLPYHARSEAVLARLLQGQYPDDQLAIINEGLDSETAAAFLRRYDRTFARHPQPDYLLIRYGVNDRREYGVASFALQLAELVQRLQSDFPAARIVLETGIFVDYPDHYEFDRNTVLAPIYAVVRALAAAEALPLVDIYARMQRETAAGNWDLRVRGYGVVDEDIPVLGAGQDHLHAGDVRWFTNIHPNPAGVAAIAAEQAAVFAQHWPTTLRPAALAVGAGA